MLVREIFLSFLVACLLQLSEGKSVADSQPLATFALIDEVPELGVEGEALEGSREGRQYGGFRGGYGGGHDGFGGGYGYGGGNGGYGGYGGGHGGYGGYGGIGGGYGGGYGGYGGGYGDFGGGYPSYHKYGHYAPSYGHGYGNGYGNGYDDYRGGDYGHHHHHGYGHSRGFLPQFDSPYFAPPETVFPFPYAAPQIHEEDRMPSVLLGPSAPVPIPQPLPQPAVGPLLPAPSPPGHFAEAPATEKPASTAESAPHQEKPENKEEEPEKNLTVKDAEKEECICKKKSQENIVPKV